MGFSTEWAPTAPELGACVECGLCLPHCPTFRLTGDESASPRGRLAAMSAVAGDRAGFDDTFAEIMSFCLQCRACEAACPSLVPFGRAMEGARAELAAADPSQGRWSRRVAGRWVGNRRLVRLATIGAAVVQRLGSWVAPPRLRRGLGGLRRLGFRHRTVIGHVSSGTPTVGILAGCVVDPWFGRVNDAAIALLEAAGYGVIAPESQGCCGALAAHSGAAEAAERMARINAEAFADVDVIVATAAGCSAHLAGYAHWGESTVQDRARDALVVVAEAIERGALPTLPESGERVAVQDPCHHQQAQRIVSEPRTILRAAGYEVVDVDPSGMCCGAAGLYSITRPETSAQLGSTKADEVYRTGCLVVASANAGCEMQLRSHLDDSIRVVHPLELYAEAIDALR